MCITYYRKQKLFSFYSTKYAKKPNQCCFVLQTALLLKKIEEMSGITMKDEFLVGYLNQML